MTWTSSGGNEDDHRRPMPSHGARLEHRAHVDDGRPPRGLAYAVEPIVDADTGRELFADVVDLVLAFSGGWVGAVHPAYPVELAGTELDSGADAGREPGAGADLEAWTDAEADRSAARFTIADVLEAADAVAVIDAARAELQSGRPALRPEADQAAEAAEAIGGRP